MCKRHIFRFGFARSLCAKAGVASFLGSSTATGSNSLYADVSYGLLC